jgi:hypothetical protein
VTEKSERTRWISIAVKVPPIVREFGGREDKLYGESNPVLAFNGDCHVAFLYKSGTWGTVHGEKLEQVTHWMPLPEIPRKAGVR